jgi:hypothetical protein
LFIVFPFNFAHLGDLLPSSLQFLLSWIPNYLGRIILLLVGLGGLFNSVYTPVIYFSVRREYTPGTLLPSAREKERIGAVRLRVFPLILLGCSPGDRMPSQAIAFKLEKRLPNLNQDCHSPSRLDSGGCSDQQF